ncbi:unnamed protein product [Ranitomeya imitator]|uniref:Uncharacterized protein n=1 Tax=Ranitomeya imitator TaxID=111125 RepID=A0ABN9M6D7_9NEOB|nr:unnamed protein product [Ranitomeya imitator]
MKLAVEESRPPVPPGPDVSCPQRAELVEVRISREPVFCSRPCPSPLQLVVHPGEAGPGSSRSSEAGGIILRRRRWHQEDRSARHNNEDGHPH